MNNEIYKTIPGYPDYQVSNLGNVKSFAKYPEGKLLKQWIGTTGYPSVKLCVAGTKKSIKTHKMVQLAFNLGKGVCDHMDGDPTNNSLSNLKIGNNRSNQQNLKCHRNGKLVGTSLYKSREVNPWGARIRLQGVLKHLGYFATEMEAHLRYLKACDEL